MNPTATLDHTPSTTATTAEPAEQEWEPLNATDRCDKCPPLVSRAYVRVIYRTGDLLFCNHDFRAQEAAIRKYALKVIDESGQLTARERTVGNGFA